MRGLVAWQEAGQPSNLATFTCAQVLPRLSALLADWHPLEEPQRGRAEFAAWRPLLESDAQREAIFQVRAALTGTLLAGAQGMVRTTAL